MKRLIYLLALPMLVLTSCSNSTSDAEEDKRAPQSAESRRAEIDKMEADLVSNPDMTKQVNRAKADELVKRYSNYISMNSGDSASAHYLYKAADLSIGLGNYEASINFLDRLTEDHPDFDKIVEIYLFKGFIYETYLQSHANAVKAYEKLILKYPNHRLAKDAQAALDNLTLSDEDLIKKFEEMNKKEV